MISQVTTFLLLFIPCSEIALAREGRYLFTHIKLFQQFLLRPYRQFKKFHFFSKFVFCLAISFSFMFLVCLLLTQPHLLFQRIENLQGRGRALHKESKEKQIIIVRNCKKERKSREKRQIYAVLWHSIRNTQYFQQYLIHVEEHEELILQCNFRKEHPSSQHFSLQKLPGKRREKSKIV